MSDRTEVKARPVKIPGPDPPITVERNAGRVAVTVAGRIVVDTRETLTFQEEGYLAVQHVPRGDVDMTLLERSAHATYCRYQGDRANYSVLAGRRAFALRRLEEQPGGYLLFRMRRLRS